MAGSAIDRRTWPTSIRTWPHSIGRVLVERVSAGRLTEHPAENVNNSSCRSVPMADLDAGGSDGSSGSPTHSRSITHTFALMLNKSTDH